LPPTPQGPLKWALDFIVPLRARVLSRIPQVVLLLREQPHPVDWAALSLFPEIYVVLGSRRDLRRGNAAQASKIVLFSPYRADDDEDSSVQAPEPEDFFNDASTILALRDVEMQYRAKFVIADMMNPTATRLVNPKFGKHASVILNSGKILHWRPGADQVPDYHFNTYFASGRVFTNSLLDSLLAQAFFNADLMKIVQCLFGHRSRTGSSVYQILIPPKMVHKTYGDLYQFLAEECETIPLGLYRGYKPHAAPSSYVYTAPRHDTRLESTDRVFVLAHEEPLDKKRGLVSTFAKALRKAGRGLGALRTGARFFGGERLSEDIGSRPPSGDSILTASGPSRAAFGRSPGTFFSVDSASSSASSDHH
jgi:Calcium-activated potassium channel slowpoke-like RCK domain